MAPDFDDMASPALLETKSTPGHYIHPGGIVVPYRYDAKIQGIPAKLPRRSAGASLAELAREVVCMSFRKKTNRHERWQHFVAGNKGLFESTKLPESIFANEKRFDEFLVTGTFESSTLLLSLTDEEFMKLKEIVDRWFDHCMFDVFQRELFRRFKRYG